MKVKEIMTKKLFFAMPDTDLPTIAKMMADENVGEIPIVDNKDHMKAMGVVTDRDIATRAVAKNKNPLQMKAQDVMSTPVVTVKQDADLTEVARLMEKNMIRRVPVVDENGMLCGIVAQADIALKSSDRMTSDVVEKVSKPTERSNKV